MALDSRIAERDIFVTAEREDGLVYLLGVEHPQTHEQVEILHGQARDRQKQVRLQFRDDVLYGSSHDSGNIVQ